jgi:chemotaxis protein CheD
MKNNAPQYKKVDLLPGKLCIAEEPTVIWTLLGSCLSIVFHNQRLGVGAMCHAQLAEEWRQGDRCSDRCPNPCFTNVPNADRFKYVSCSLRYMYDQFTQRGITPDEITVKLFGGATVLPLSHSLKSIGDENIEVAQKMIREFNLRLFSKHVGGTAGRTLYFYSDTGEVLLRMHKSRSAGILPAD